jgi:thiol-disulfide isomerase/thioredoxin
MKSTSLISIIFSLLFIGCGKSSRSHQSDLTFIPQILYETATLSCKINGLPTADKRGNKAEIILSKVATGDISIQDVPINADGTLSFSIPIQCTSLASLEIDKNPVITCLIPGRETKMEISYDGNQLNPIKIENSVGFTAEDAMIILNWPWGLPKIGNEIIAPEEFSRRIIEGIPEVLKPVENNINLSDPAKQILTAEIKLMSIYHGLFNYSDYIKNANANQPKKDSLHKEYHLQSPDKSYYSFLKYFNLNDPSYLTSGFYPMILQYILGNETFAIPDIEEMQIDIWLKKVKEILKEDIGTDEGLFYDLLVSTSYAKQINNKTPLSNIQKQNIKSYFKNQSFANILLYKNDEALKFMSSNKARKINVTSPGNVMDSIISKYKGKVVFVDFWATWCGPCQRAMIKSESVRKDFENKDVVFVYVTDPSSPKYMWEQQINKIGGDHYYITEKEWNYLNKVYDFAAIPHYLIFDKSGLLKHNYQTFMGIDSMRKWIEESLITN